MTIAFLALGANLGNRLETLQAALEALPHQFLQINTVSEFLETAPMGGPSDQPPYLNAIAQVNTSFTPDELLAHLQTIEQKFGRVRTIPNAPRTLDLDIILYDDLIRTQPDPQIPHPRMHERRFVLEPLVQIAPQVRHPLLGLTAAELLAELSPPCDLLGRRALVTGATSGIGRAIALRLARAGADVIVHGRSAMTAESTADVIRDVGRRAEIVLEDLSQVGAGERLAERAWQVWDGLEIVVANAGTDILTGEASKWTFTQKLQALWSVDVMATIELSRALGERMRATGRGVLLTMGWDQAETGFAGDSGQLFAATKGAVMAFTRSLALNLAPIVRVNCLAPGWIRTAWGATASPAWQDRVYHETPLRRWGTAIDVARVAHWLASDQAAFITGQTVRINGGTVRT